MRWFWFDRYTEFVSGRYAVAIKNVTLAEEHLHDHFPDAPVMPNSLIIEGLAQTGGLLVGEARQFERRVVLAKVSKAKFHLPALPGDTLTYRTDVEYIREDGAMVTAKSTINGQVQTEAEILFAYLTGDLAESPLFQPMDFMRWLRLSRMYEVGRNEQGQPITPPAILLDHDPYANAV
jgi:3-hydroxyacyl-[acyl-carrier-protein] dehydratase